MNDTFGHQSGDDELRSFGQYLRNNVRKHDSVARVGGDEFILIIRRAGAEGLEVADRLVAGWGRTSPRTTLSAGVAIHVAGIPSEFTFADADNALYTSKREGGGRCSLAPTRSIDQTAPQAGRGRVPPLSFQADWPEEHFIMKAS